MDKLYVGIGLGSKIPTEIIKAIENGYVPEPMIKGSAAEFCKNIAAAIENGIITKEEIKKAMRGGLSFSAEDMIRQGQMLNNLRSLM